MSARSGRRDRLREKARELYRLIPDADIARVALRVAVMREDEILLDAMLADLRR